MDGSGGGQGEGWRVMGRRTVRGAVVAAVLCAAMGAVLPGPAGAVAAPDAYTYDFAEGARTVEGAASTTDAVGLEPGGTYRSALPVNGRLYFRLALDATSNAYVSATAVPRQGATVSSTDGVKVSVQDADARSCSYDSTRFGPSRSPHPVAAWASRVTDGGDDGVPERRYVLRRRGAHRRRRARRPTTGTWS